MNESNELIARIESLERKNRRLVRVGGAALVALAGLGAMSLRSACDTVSAERFVLRDAQGRQRALLTAYDTGGAPQFALYDNQGRAVAMLGVEKSGAFLSLADANAEKPVRYGAGCQMTGEKGSATGGAVKPSCGSKDSGSTMTSEETR